MSTFLVILCLSALVSSLAVWKILLPWVGGKLVKKAINNFSGSTYDYTHTTPKGKEVHVTLTYTGYYDPGVTSGPVDSCYPPEGELDILCVETEKGKVLDFNAWVKKMRITPKEVKSIEERLYQVIQDRRYEPEDDDDGYYI